LKRSDDELGKCSCLFEDFARLFREKPPPTALAGKRKPGHYYSSEWRRQKSLGYWS